MKSFFDALTALESELLLQINSCNTPILDAFMYSISNPIVWIPLVAVLLYYLFAGKSWQSAVLLIFCIGLCLGVCHLLGNVLAKEYFARPRPTFTAGLSEHLHLVYGYTGRSFSFFSGHATNFFAAATVLACVVGRRTHALCLYLIVSVVAYSRMYQGVHFLSDVLVGIVVGVSIGALFAGLYRRLCVRWLAWADRPTPQCYNHGYTLWMGTLICALPIWLIFSWQIAHILQRLGYH